ncbi:hypothetical protein U2G60_001019 [Vibrio fluvialis]|nr:hypothetical protein [Vibrio fluvialis]
MKQLNQIHFHPLAPALRTISFILLFLLAYLTLPISVMLAEQFSQNSFRTVFTIMFATGIPRQIAMFRPHSPEQTPPHNGKYRET